MVGGGGRVVGLDVDAERAARGALNLAPWPQASAQPGDGSIIDATYDVLYVNAGATHARRARLDALGPGGRLVMPLTAHLPQFRVHGVGAMIRVARGAGSRWPVAPIGPAGFFDCVGARDADLEPAVKRLLGGGFEGLVLERTPHAAGEACLVHHEDGCLQPA